MLACTTTTHPAARAQRNPRARLNPRHSIAAASILRRPKARHAAATAAAAVKQEQEEVATASAPQSGAVDPTTQQQQQQASWTWEDSDDGTAAYAAFFLWLALGSWPALQSLSLAGVYSTPNSHHTVRTCPTPGSQHTPLLLYCCLQQRLHRPALLPWSGRADCVHRRPPGSHQQIAPAADSKRGEEAAPHS